MNAITRLSILTAIPLLLGPDGTPDHACSLPDPSWQQTIVAGLAAQEYQVSAAGAAARRPTASTTCGRTSVPRA